MSGFRVETLFLFLLGGLSFLLVSAVKILPLNQTADSCGGNSAVPRPLAILPARLPACPLACLPGCSSQAELCQTAFVPVVPAASSVDFVMSDEDDGSFLSLPAAAFSQRSSLAAELNETNTLGHELLIQVKKNCL